MADLLKMSEVVAQTGVEKSTVQHYLREGLLPGPAARPHRNMAYYSADVVERIALIRQIQTEQRLPLAEIKLLLADHESLDELRTWLSRRAQGPEAAFGPLERSVLLAETGLVGEQLDRLEALCFLRPDRRGPEILYSSNDVAVVRSVGAMQKAMLESGLNRENGFEIEDLVLYMDAMRSLLVDELALLTRILGKVSRARGVGLAESGLEATSSLLLALRRRIVMDLVEEGSGSGNAFG